MWTSSVVNRSEIEERLEELDAERDQFMEETGLDEVADSEAWDEALKVWETHNEEGQEWLKLSEVLEEMGSADLLIAEDYWVEYVQDMLEGCGDIPDNLPWYVEIDWEATAKNVAGDYSTITIDGKEWHYQYN
jgi:hypothetical protein